MKVIKIFKIGFLNALGREGSEKSPELLTGSLDVSGVDIVDIDVDNNDISESISKIERDIRENIENNEVEVFLGGDHSITYPVLRGLFNNDNNFLIVFDAHADCDFCNKEPTHEEWLRAVVDNGIVRPENIIIIGLRRFWDNEKEFLDSKGIKYFSCEIADSGLVNLEGIGDYVTEKANSSDIDNVYVSVDMDVFEPCVAPAVHYPETGGLMSRDFFYLWKRILRLPNLRAMDLVEIVPENDEKYDFRTIRLGAGIVRMFVEMSKKSA